VRIEAIGAWKIRRMKMEMELPNPAYKREVDREMATPGDRPQ